MNMTAIQQKPFVNFSSFTTPVAKKSMEKGNENYSIMVDGQKYSLQSGSSLSNLTKTTENTDSAPRFVAIA